MQQEDLDVLHMVKDNLEKCETAKAQYLQELT